MDKIDKYSSIILPLNYQLLPAVFLSGNKLSGPILVDCRPNCNVSSFYTRIFPELFILALLSSMLSLHISIALMGRIGRRCASWCCSCPGWVRQCCMRGGSISGELFSISAFLNRFVCHHSVA
jgi:hypothetical protein